MFVDEISALFHPAGIYWQASCLPPCWAQQLSSEQKAVFLFSYLRDANSE